MGMREGRGESVDERGGREGFVGERWKARDGKRREGEGNGRRGKKWEASEGRKNTEDRRDGKEESKREEI